MNVFSSLSRANTQFRDAKFRLDKSIEMYTAAVVDLGCMLGMQLITRAQNIQMSVDELSTRMEKLMSEFEDHTKLVQTEFHNISQGASQCISSIFGD